LYSKNPINVAESYMRIMNFKKGNAMDQRKTQNYHNNPDIELFGQSVPALFCCPP
jgi:hypothetical protein